MKHLVPQMEIEITRIRNEINQSSVDQRHEGEEEHHSLQKLLSVRLRVLDGTELFFDHPSMQERVFDDQFAEIKGGARSKLGY